MKTDVLRTYIIIEYIPSWKSQKPRPVRTTLVVEAGRRDEEKERALRQYGSTPNRLSVQRGPTLRTNSKARP